MDFFGIGAALKGAALTYFQAARATGRTTSLVESVKDGDRVVFLTARESDRFKRLTRERGVEVDCVVISTADPSEIFKSGTPQGRTIFDHTWVERYYLDAIEHAQKTLGHIERQSSGYGEAHRETRRTALKMSKFKWMD